MASEGLHESAERLRPETKDLHRAIVSLMEELEAIDWYGQPPPVIDCAGKKARARIGVQRVTTEGFTWDGGVPHNGGSTYPVDSGPR